MRKPEEDTQPLPRYAEQPQPPFIFGDRTVFALRAQAFALGDEYGTIVPRSVIRPAAEEAVENAPVDPITRLEQKLDAAMKMIETLQKRIDSMDAAVARALTRM
jgi:hypothetical protein